MIADDSTPMRKYLIAASFDFESCLRQPARTNVGIEIVSSATKIEMRSRADAITTMPSTEREHQEVELALVVVAFGDVVGRHQQHDVRDHEEEALERQRVVVDHERAAEHRRVGAVGGERDHRDERGQHADRRDAATL